MRFDSGTGYECPISNAVYLYTGWLSPDNSDSYPCY